MARRDTSRGRIEPVFGTPERRGDELRVEPGDRVVPAPQESRPAKRTGRVEPKVDKPARKAAPARQAQQARRREPPAKAARAARKRRGGFFGFVRGAVYWGLVLAIWGGIAAACIIGYYGVKLPSMESWAVPKRPPNARIVSVDGELVANRGVGGEAMRLDEMSPWIPQAVIAIEDRRFRYHFGVDPFGLARAVTMNAVAGRTVQGGSTLTQQLAKNLFLEPERTLERKIQEALLALWLETKFSKDELLELYLNRVYFGSGAYGVDAAARRYFDKSARDLSLAEAALLAGLLKAPSRLSPARDAEAANERAQLVLSAMRREGFITEREASLAMAMEPGKARRYLSGSQHYVADMVMAQLPGLIGEMRGDVIVQTTIDFGLQKAAEAAVGETLAAKGKKANAGQAALVSLDGTGAIRALVGGADYAKSQFNRAADAKRQPGSAFKPFVYLAALEAGRTPATVREDAPVRIGKWTPENYDKKYRGPVTLDTALADSLNTVAAQLVMEVGPKTVAETAQRLGIKSALEKNASIALGTSEVTLTELTAAYAPFSNGGYAVTPWLVRRVTSINGDILYERNDAPQPRVVGSRELGMMNAMLRSVLTEGTGRAAAVEGWDIAGKTGTTDNSRDALFAGYSSNLVTGVWFGNDGGEPMKKVTGGTLPAETFRKFMTAAHKGVPPAPLPGVYDPEPRELPAPAEPGDMPFAEGRVEGMAGGTAPRPAAEVGANTGERRKPRNIFELIFGKKPG